MDLNQWNLEAVNMPDDQLVADTASGSAVKVAVMDSGITPLSGIEIAGTVDFANLGEDNVNENPLFDDPSGHGTGIAGMIAAKGKDSVLKGIAKDAQIYSVKVLDTQNQSTISKIVSGIYWCIDHNIDVINMSFGTAKYSETLKKAVEDASAAGIIMVASAGNRGEEAETMDYPCTGRKSMDAGCFSGIDSGRWNQYCHCTCNGSGCIAVAGLSKSRIKLDQTTFNEFFCSDRRRRKCRGFRHYRSFKSRKLLYSERTGRCGTETGGRNGDF